MTSTFGEMQDSRSAFQSVFWVMLTVGGMMTALGASWSVKTVIFLSRSEKTEGEIVRLERVSSSSRLSSGWTYYPVFSYRDRSNHQWEGRPPFSSKSFAEYRPKQKVMVVFDPDDPKVSNLDTLAANWTFPGLILIAGSWFLFVVWRMKKSDDKSRTSPYSQRLC